jgi:hypothetical protein
MQRGMIVNVYNADGKFEGRARLLSEYRKDDGDGLSVWFVEFLDEPGDRYLRTINKANAFNRTVPQILDDVLGQFEDEED